MRVALLQIRQRADSHAANLQLIIAAVHEAARTKPAPDLLVLPAGCDSGGRDTERLTPTIARGCLEAIAWQARDYGVYIAAGLHAYVAERWMPWAVLLDPDGDAVAGSVVEADPPSKEAAAPVGLRRCELGCVGIRALTTVCGELGDLAVREGVTVMILPSLVGYGGSVHKAEHDSIVRLRESATGDGTTNQRLGGAWCCVATPASPTARVVSSEDAGTFVVSAEGEVVVKATTAGQEILFADVPHTPVTLRAVGRGSNGAQSDPADGSTRRMDD